MCILETEIHEFYTSLQSRFFPFIVCIHSYLSALSLRTHKSKHNTYRSQYSDDCGLHDRRTWDRRPVVAMQLPFVKYLSSSGAQPAVHQMGTRGSFGGRGVRRQELDANQSLFSSTAIRRPRPTVGCDSDALPCCLAVTTSDFFPREWTK